MIKSTEIEQKAGRLWQRRRKKKRQDQKSKVLPVSLRMRTSCREQSLHYHPTIFRVEESMQPVKLPHDQFGCTACPKVGHFAALAVHVLTHEKSALHHNEKAYLQSGGASVGHQIPFMFRDARGEGSIAFSVNLKKCKTALEFSQRSGAMGFQCMHLRSVSYCPSSQEDNTNLSDDILNDMVANKWISDATKMTCLQRRAAAESVNSPLSKIVELDKEESSEMHTCGQVPLVKRRDDEVSIGSTPLAKKTSNQASDYASSPVKTKTVTESRPLSIPVKVIPENPAGESWTTSEERVKELISQAWDAVKRLTLQLEIQACCVFLPNDSLPSPSTIISGDIPGTVRSWYHNQASMPGTLVVCLPQITILSTGHKYMEPLQELPFVVFRPILEEGDAFPWTISLNQFSVYTLLGQQQSLSLLEPMGCTSTLAVTSHKLQSSEGRHSFVVCLHVDLQPVHVKCSNPQVQLLFELLLSWSSTWTRLQKHGFLRQTSNIPEPLVVGAPSSPVRSSAGTALPDTSTCSPSADFGSPTEGDSVAAVDDSPFADTVTLEQKTSTIGGTSGKVSLWMQWMLPKVTAKLYAPDPTTKKTEICVISELEDLSASVDVQDVYTKIKCKVGSFNIDHYRSSPEEGARSSDSCGGVVLSCTDKLNRRTVLVRPVSKQDSFSHFSGFFPPTAAKVLEGSHQQHGFLSITYTQAVTKNVRHKLTTRPERPSRSSGTSAGHRVSPDPLADSAPQYLREILLTAQPFDIVLSCPLLATVAGVFQTIVPRRYRERGKSVGQPMRSHTLTSRSLPLIYINTSVIRIFCPGSQDRHSLTEPVLKKEDTLVLKLGSLSMAPQADNPLTRTVLRKDIYHIRRHQERRAILTPILTDFSVRVTAAPAIIFSKNLSPDSAQAEEVVVCGHSLEVNLTSSLDFYLSVAQVQLLHHLFHDNMVGVESDEREKEIGKSALNQPEVQSVSPPISLSPTFDPPLAATQGSLAGLTAEDILNSNTPQPASAMKRGSLLSLDSLPTPSRSSARQALGVTIVRQPGRRGPGDQLLEPLLYLQVLQPSVLLSCHHRKQRIELSVFDVALRGVTSDYKCLDLGKTLPESLDYNVSWLQTVAGEVDRKTGIPPPLLCLQLKDFLNGPAELNIELSRPLKINPTLAKLEQAKSYLKKIYPKHTWDTSTAKSSASSCSPHISPSKTRTSTPRSDTRYQAPVGTFGALGITLSKISLHTGQIVMVMETEAHPKKPSVILSVSAMKGCLNIKTGPRNEDSVQSASVLLEVQDLLVKTGLRERVYVFLDPSLAGHPWRHVGMFWGQEHLSCLKLIEEHLSLYLQLSRVETPEPCLTAACHTQPPALPDPPPLALNTAPTISALDTSSTSRTQPGPHEVVFYSETEDCPGIMLWRYPEPRVLTFVRITPVPFNTTEDPEISTADLGDVLQVPCCLEYWDELKQGFVPYREFSLSESRSCQLHLPSLSLTEQQKELVASDLWRIVVNNNGEGGDEQSLDSDCGSMLHCDQLVSPMALAACTRVDSCFAPWFVPSLGVSLQLAQMEVHLCHHLQQLGTVPPHRLRPFLPDRKLPQEQEFMVTSAREPRVLLRQWSNGPRYCQEFNFFTQLECKLLEYRNLTHVQLLQQCALQGQATAMCCPQSTVLDANVFVDPVFFRISQYSIHTVDTALKSWQQNDDPDSEELVYSHYVICNDTHETLRFGQVDTDENVLLASLHSHQYSWRSHKSPQVIICGRQVMCSYLSQDIELRVVQHYVGSDSQTVVKEHCDCLEAGGKLPSYVLEDAEMTELCLRAKGDEDWSQDVQLERRDKTTSSSVVQVPCSSGTLLYVWCTLITLEPDTHMQQRVVVFSPLFVMRSHLPDPVIVHVEKRRLGLRESQLILGQGHQEPLLNTEADQTHHLTFQAREDEDASNCAVPISTSLIKQIMNKTGCQARVDLILNDFYGAQSSKELQWPYVCKDSDRTVSEPLAQWDSPMQVKLSCWKPGLNTLLVELLPWALLANHSQWDLWLFEGETIVLQIPAGKVIVPPNFKEAFQIGIYWAHTNTVHKSTALKLVHDVTSPRWKEGLSSDVVTLDEEGFVEADITLGGVPGKQKLCQFCVSSVVRHGIQILQIEDKMVLVNNTSYTIQYRPLLTKHSLGSNDQACQIAESTMLTLPPCELTSQGRPYSVPCWDLVHTGAQGSVEFPLPLKYMLFSLLPQPASSQWSLPAPIRPDLPRLSVSVPGEGDNWGGPSSRALVLTYQEHLGIIYLTLNEDHCPRMIVHNKCPIPLLLKEICKETPRAELYCLPLPANSSLHHELYHHFSSFPECKQNDALPTLQLKTTSDHCTPEWTDPIDINSPGTQVVFLAGFGCLYIDVSYEKGTLVLSLAPEAAWTLSLKLSFRALLSEASVVLNDDITNPSGSVELLRLTLTKLLLSLSPAPVLIPTDTSDDPNADGPSVTTLITDGSRIQVYCYSLQVDNQLYNRASFHFPVLLCQDQRVEVESGRVWTSDSDPFDCPDALEAFKHSCFLSLQVNVAADRYTIEEVIFHLQPARVYLEDTFVYYIKTLFHTYIPAAAERSSTERLGPAPGVPEQVLQSVHALVHPVRLQRLTIEPVNLLVSIHASLKLYIASDHTPLSFSLFERGPLFTTARQLVHALAMHYAAGALFRAGWVVGSLEILGSPASLVRSIGNGVSDFFRLPYEGLTRGPGAFVSGVSRGTSSFVKHISKGTLTSITNLATSLARNMDRLSLDEEHYTRQEEWRRQLPESLGDGLRQGLSRLGISLLGAIAGIVDQPMQNFQRNWELQSSTGSTAKGVISGVGKGIVGVFTKPIGGAAELVSQTGYGILHGAGLWELPKQLYLPLEQKSAQAPNSHLKYVWKMLQSLGRPEVHMALEVTIVSGSGQEHAGCLLLTSDVLFVVSLSEDTQQQAFPITEVECEQDPGQKGELTLTLQQQTVTNDPQGDGVRERLSEQQYKRLVDFVSRSSQFLAPSTASLQLQPTVTLAEPPPSVAKSYRYLVDPAFAKVFVSKFHMVKNKALRIGFH
ncbi:hypothetical protein WMY93_007064 [Mugilogobius chulae]|uniref:Vacuolar protein sorting-associated protein 13B n=1 Tax=Mugilogobius chulae TaxID=88201 RepID=A0AAW0PX60_9GOBI